MPAAMTQPGLRRTFGGRLPDPGELDGCRNLKSESSPNSFSCMLLLNPIQSHLIWTHQSYLA
jgi:hypothetical protein